MNLFFRLSAEKVFAGSDAIGFVWALFGGGAGGVGGWVENDESFGFFDSGLKKCLQVPTLSGLCGRSGTPLGTMVQGIGIANGS